MKILKYFLTTIFALTIVLGLSAQDLIKVSELKQIHGKQNLLIVSCQSPEEYQKAHIPNSININHKELYKDGPVRGLLKGAEEIAIILSSKGISNEKTIILYDAGTYKYSTRLYWILDYMGATDLRILDGQMIAWRRSRSPLTKLIPEISKSSFIPTINPNKIATMAEVIESINNPQAILIDARSINEYNGSEDSDYRLGHIPGAVNIPFEEVLTKSKKLKSKNDLEKLFNEKGISADNDIILYCASSVRATSVYFALKSGLEFPKVKVYDGAYLEWESDPSNPVE